MAWACALTWRLTLWFSRFFYLFIYFFHKTHFNISKIIWRSLRFFIRLALEILRKNRECFRQMRSMAHYKWCHVLIFLFFLFLQLCFVYAAKRKAIFFVEETKIFIYLAIFWRNVRFDGWVRVYYVRANKIRPKKAHKELWKRLLPSHNSRWMKSNWNVFYNRLQSASVESVSASCISQY